MKRTLAAALIIVTLAISLFAGVLLSQFNPSKGSSIPTAFVGVAYCGNTVSDGKLMIDKVKGYTNLFVLQSGTLQRDFPSIDKLGDYAIAAGMYFLPYFGQVHPSLLAWVESAKQKWGEHLLGVYYSDEAGGKMLDGYVEFKDAATGDTILKTTYGDIFVTKPNGIEINYELNGIIHLYQPLEDGNLSDTAFYPNGEIQVVEADNNGLSFTNYEELMRVKPFTTLNETAQRFLAREKSNIEALRVNSTKVFTSDYALYWFDYLSGYDVILGQIGWNYSLNQQIALIRGAATLQNKSWGIVITWKYQNSPYLANGTEILSQMQTAFACGAKYFVLFDYYFDSDTNPYGTMHEEQFQALKSFWKEDMQNSKGVQDSIKADTVLVFPPNFGWGTRWDGDKVWGIFVGDEKTHQIWGIMQASLQQRGFGIDIVIDDQNYPLNNLYKNIILANYTKTK
jgi:hypothetical protein